MNEIKIDKKVSCCSCQRQLRIDGTAWVYCSILPEMACIEGFDETGELHGCNKHEVGDNENRREV